MQIGISTASFYPKELEHGIEYAAQLGYRRVELFINSESEYGVPFRRMLKQKLRELGLAVVSVHPFTSAMEGHLLFSDYARRTRDALDQYGEAPGGPPALAGRGMGRAVMERTPRAGGWRWSCHASAPAACAGG